LIIYICCMAGVLAERSDSAYPSYLAGSALLYMLESMYVFEGKFYWEAISQEQVISSQEDESLGDVFRYRKATRDTYVQPELADDINLISERLKAMRQKEAEEMKRRESRILLEKEILDRDLERQKAAAEEQGNKAAAVASRLLLPPRARAKAAAASTT